MTIFTAVSLVQAGAIGALFSAIGVAVLAPLVVLVSVTMLFMKRYKRCPANRVLVISGPRRREVSRRACISGGGAFVWPVIQEYAYLGLEPIQIDIPLKDALSLENIRVAVPSVFTVAVGTESEVRQNAAMRMLGLRTEEIKGRRRTSSSVSCAR